MWVVYVFYGLSGFVSLGYQVAWFRIFIDQFGSTNLTFILVLCNFIGGLGAGALASRRMTPWLSRGSGLHEPLRIYGLAELIVAGTMLLTLVLPLVPAHIWGTFPYQLDTDGIYHHTTFYQYSKILLGTLTVFIPCFFMGLTFPLLCDRFRHDERFPSALYAWNTLGAGCGVLACEFLLLPYIGHDHTLQAYIATNTAMGLFFLVRGNRIRLPTAVNRTGRQVQVQRKRRRSYKQLAATVSYPYSVVIACAVLSGLLSGAVEADVFKRMWFINLTETVTMSFISFWAILAIFLASLTVRTVSLVSLPLIRLAYLLALVYYWGMVHSAQGVSDWMLNFPRGRYAQFVAEHGLTGDWHVEIYFSRPELLFITGLFVFPTMYLLALLLPYVCNQVQGNRQHIGFAYGLNTIAFCLGIVGFSWLAPWVNQFYAFKLLIVLFLISVLFLLTMNLTRPLTFWRPVVATATFVVGCFFVPTGFDKSYFKATDAPAIHPVRALKSNGAHTTFVVEDPSGDRLFFDGHSMSSTHIGAQTYMRLMAHFPLLIHPEPKQALLICFGVGNTASAIASHPSIEQIDVVDLNQRVFETASEFAATNEKVYLDTRMRRILDDGRNYLKWTNQKYDLITSEPPPPRQEGVYRLYTKEYYKTVLNHLTPHGLMTQWLPIDKMPKESVQLAVATFIDVFPNCLLFVGNEQDFILMGGPARTNLAAVEKHFTQIGTIGRDLQRIGISHPLDLIARVVKTDQVLRSEYGGFKKMSDQYNDFSRTTMDPRNPAIVSYNPVLLLQAEETSELNQRKELNELVMNLARLKSRLRDFPSTSLQTVQSSQASGVTFADVDWLALEAINTTAFQLMQTSMQNVRSPAASGQRQRAIDLFEKSLSHVDQQSHVLKSIANLFSYQGEFEKSLQAWNKYLLLAPQDEQGYHNKGHILYLLQRYDESISTLRKGIALNPDNAKVHKIMGDSLLQLGRPTKAIASYDRALAIQSDYQGARENRRQALAARKSLK